MVLKLIYKNKINALGIKIKFLIHFLEKEHLKFLNMDLKKLTIRNLKIDVAADTATQPAAAGGEAEAVPLRLRHLLQSLANELLDLPDAIKELKEIIE